MGKMCHRCGADGQPGSDRQGMLLHTELPVYGFKMSLRTVCDLGSTCMPASVKRDTNSSDQSSEFFHFVKISQTDTLSFIMIMIAIK